MQHNIPSYLIRISVGISKRSRTFTSTDTQHQKFATLSSNSPRWNGNTRCNTDDVSGIICMMIMTHTYIPWRMSSMLCKKGRKQTANATTTVAPSLIRFWIGAFDLNSLAKRNAKTAGA